MKIIKKVQVKNKMGLHTRPATSIVKLLQHSKCEVTLSYKKETVNAKSILGILMLAATRNTTLTITAEGEDAPETVELLVQAFEKKFEEI